MHGAIFTVYGKSRFQSLFREQANIEEFFSTLELE